MSAPLVLDDGLQFGLGVFETIAVEGGHGVLLQAHLARLARSAAALDLGELPARGVTREAVSGYIRAHCPPHSACKLILTQENLILQNRPNPYGPERYDRGFVMDFSAVVRNDTSPLVGHKTMNYGDCILEHRAAAAAGMDERIFLNTRGQLAEATRVMQRRINDAHMAAGVTMWDPATAYIGPEVEIAPDVELLPNVMLLGKTTIGEDSVVGPDSRLTDTRVGCGCRIDETVAVEALIDDGATCGPRAYLRPAAHLCEGAKAGTHVEIKKSTIGKGSKVPHLSYIGDTTMGEGVNIGAGSITCNYDGANKHATVIEDGAFVGSDTMMVAPVTIGAGALVGAGSTITKDVTPGALALGRARQQEIEGWVAAHPIEKKK